jgi:hypothetical protein
MKLKNYLVLRHFIANNKIKGKSRKEIIELIKSGKLVFENTEYDLKSFTVKKSD